MAAMRLFWQSRIREAQTRFLYWTWVQKKLHKIHTALPKKGTRPPLYHHSHARWIWSIGRTTRNSWLAYSTYINFFHWSKTVRQKKMSYIKIWTTLVWLHHWSQNEVKAGPPPPLDLSFWSCSTFLHHGMEKVERHLLWKFHKKIQRKSWSNVPPKLVACIGFLYKVVHKIGRLRKFNCSRGI